MLECGLPRIPFPATGDRPMRPFRAGPSVLVLLAALLVPLAAGATSLQDTRVAADEWIASMDQYYALHPDLTTASGSGWKPFGRAKWEYQTLLRDRNELPPPNARWTAWEEIQRRFPAGPAPRAGWFQLGPENYGGRMLALSWDPTNANIVYAGAAGGGLWKSTNHGNSWRPMTDDLMSISVSGVAVSQTDPNIVVIGTGELPIGLVGGIHSIGILRSTDAGETWLTTSITHTLDEWYGFHVVEAGPNGTFLAGANDGLWRSSDDGATWTEVLPTWDYYDVKWKPGDPNTVFAVRGNAPTGNNVKISTDDGLTWVRAGTGQSPGYANGKSKIAVTAANPDYVYAIYTNLQGNDTNGIYRTTDGGVTWTPRNTTVNVGGQQGWYNLSLAADPNNTETILAGGVNLYRSTNGGATLTSLSSGVHVDHHDARYEPGSDSNLWVACDGGIWQSPTDGQPGTWINKNNALVTFQFYDICVAQSNAARMAGGSQDNGTPVRTSVNDWDDGLYWMDGMVCAIDASNADRIYAEGQFGALHRSLDAGLSWTSIQGGMPANAGSWETPLAIDRNNGAHLYTMRATNAPGIYRTVNGGGNWVQVSTEVPQGISISPVDGNVVWALVGNAIYTTDDGATWTTAADWGFDVGGILQIVAHPTDVASAFACFSTYAGTCTIAYTSDFGASWQNVTGDLPPIPMRDVEVDPMYTDHWYAAGAIGVWTTTNGGVNWEPYAVGLPNAVVRDLEIQETSRKLLAGTFGRGAWEVTLTTPGATDAPDVRPALVDLMLDPPMPNPASGSVLLRWASRRDGAADLSVYDVRGRLVSRIDDVQTGNGVIRKATWLTDDVAPGVYFAVVRAGDEKLSRKIIVVE